MVGIDPTLASHKLNIIVTAKPVRQKIKRFHPDYHQIIQTKVDNLLSPGFIRELKYPEWLENVVVVLKKGGKWRYAWTTRTSMKHTQKTASHFHK